MSLRALSWAYADRSIDDAPARHVLQCLAWHARDADDLAWPAAGTIAAETGYHRSTVMRHLEALERAGMIEDTGERRRRAVVYRVKCRAPRQYDDDRSVAERDSTNGAGAPFDDDRSVAQRDKILSQSATQTDKGTHDHDERAEGLEASETPSSSRYDGLNAAAETGARLAI